MSEASENDGTNVNKDQKPAFGKKSIGFFSSLALLTNNLTGPAMVQIPVMYQQAGWLFPTICMVWIGALTGFVGMYLSKSIQLIPGNRRFSQRIEFNELAKAVFPRWLYILTMVVLIFNFQANNISSIVVSAQTMDNTLLKAAKKTCALIIYPHPPGESPFQCISTAPSTDSPFGNSYVISLGYVVTLVLTVPLGILNLEDNMWVQQGGFILLIACIIAWMVQFGVSGMTTDRMPVNNFSGWGNVISTVIFNFGYVTTIPSWLNEKSPKVSIARASWISVVLSGIMFLILGLMGGYSLDFSSGDDLIAVLNDAATPNILTSSQVASYVFPIAALLSGIPVFSIIIRYNLLQEGVHVIPANLFAVVFPWVVALAFFAGDSLNLLITWSSAILFVLLNFMLPMLVYVIRQRQLRLEKSVETDEGVHAHLLSVNAHDAPPLDDAPIADDEAEVSELPHSWSCISALKFGWALLIMACGLAIATFALQIYSVA